jgi:hypothetical protein
MRDPPILPLCEHPLRGLPAYPASGEGQIGEESTPSPLTRPALSFVEGGD